MKFYSKRGHYIYIEQSSILTNLFFNVKKKSYDELVEDYVFLMQEDKSLIKLSSFELLSLPIDIVPNKKHKRLAYNFSNFKELYEHFKKNELIPYHGEDLI